MSSAKIKKRLIEFLADKYYDENSDIYLANKKVFNSYVRNNSPFVRKGFSSDDLELRDITNRLVNSYSNNESAKEYLRDRLYEQTLRFRNDPSITNNLDKPRDIEVYKSYRAGIANRPNAYYQADLADIGNLLDDATITYKKKYQIHPGFILVVVDGYSNFIYAKRLKSKETKIVASKMSEIISEMNDTKLKRFLQTDRGTEFTSSIFKNMLSSHNMELYHTYTLQKAFLAERMIREIKKFLNKLRRSSGQKLDIDKVLPGIVRKKNNSIDSRAGVTPMVLNRSIRDSVENGIENPNENEKKILAVRTVVDNKRTKGKLSSIKNQYKNRNLLSGKRNTTKTLSIGTRVYIPKFRKAGKLKNTVVFTKATTSTENDWDTKKVFVIARVHKGVNGQAEPFEYYKLKDTDNQNYVKGIFYRNELFPVNKKNLYLNKKEYKEKFLNNLLEYE